ncbi:MAG: DUF4349 domain-containing protein [Chloroflexi bacterium]|nr:DUF4349 domain-containing protein [Chloroflexota bacterium]
MKRTLLSILFFALALSTISCAAAPRPADMIAPSGAAPAATAAPMPFAPPAPEFRDKTATDANESVPDAAPAERMIVYTVQLSLEVQDTEKAANDISAIVAQYQGYVAATNMARSPKGLMRGTLTVRVPAQSLDAAQKQIEAAGLKVLSRNRNSNDVTDQYTDLEARLTNLQATEAELRKLLDTVRERTGKAEDILAVYNRLTEIRGQIEQIKGQMNVLSKTSSFATLTVSLTPREEVQVVEPEGWLPDRTAREALRSLVQAMQGLADLAIWSALFFLPVLIVFILPFVILALILRAILRRRGPRKIVPTT